jgi:endonuclease
MPIYDRPTKAIMWDFAKEKLKLGDVFSPHEAVDWFLQHFSQIKSNTVRIHVDCMAVNSRSRKHHQNIRPGSGHDLFFKIDSKRYRLWDKDNDPAPFYPSISATKNNRVLQGGEPNEVDDGLDDDDAELEEVACSTAFAYERDLANYIVKNLHVLEPGLKLYNGEEGGGVEFPAGGLRIDILAEDQRGDLVVIELKVSRGYDRVIGQVLRCIGWIKRNIAAGRAVRGMIVAQAIAEDLRLAAALVPVVSLVEYEISFKLTPISADPT